MWTFYFIALIPIVIGAILWVLNKEIVWQEWLVGSLTALIMAAVWNYCAIEGMTKDKETWSGRVIQVEHHPKWVEQWEQAHTESYPCGTDSNGNTTYCTTVYFTTEYDTHHEHWKAVVNFGSYQEKWTISYETYLKIKKEFGNGSKLGERQSFHHGGKFYSGDQNTYVTANATGFIRPVTTIKSFENKIKAAPSVFSFAKVPTNTPVFDWPRNNNPWASDRVLGTARNHIDIYAWDVLNTKLGALKRVNIIIVGFDSSDSTLGQYQQAKWIGGKKNDLVITFGGDARKPDWVFTFGWTESELCKRNIDSYIKQNGITPNIYSFLENEIIKNYKIKDWKKFDYIRVEPTPSSYIWFVLSLVIVQTGLWIYFHKNEFNKYNYNIGRYGNYFRRF